MKKILFFILASLAICNSVYSKIIPTYEFTDKCLYSTIDDGWYKATVKYSNYSNGTFATYALKVKVEYQKVTAIDFGNGGSVHSGYNNEGYIYGGGYLNFETDYNGNLVAVTTTVSVSDNNGMREFRIRIE